MNNSMPVALGTLAAAQTQGITQAMDAAIQLLNYVAPYPDGAIQLLQKVS
jgi:hypothetical protein